jgi:hypothetical protein
MNSTVTASLRRYYTVHCTNQVVQLLILETVEDSKDFWSSYYNIYHAVANTGHHFMESAIYGAWRKMCP